LQGWCSGGCAETVSSDPPSLTLGVLRPRGYLLRAAWLIPFSRQKFDAETGDLVDEETRDRLRRFLEALVEWTGWITTARPAYQRSL
jgi:hypothetical protein